MELIHTDKTLSGLDEYYKLVLQEFKKKESLKILEVGIYQGGFLQWLDNYFEGKAKLYGIDGALQLNRFREKGKYYRCDQQDRAGLEAIRENIGELDIIIEDGAHDFNCSWTTFQTFWTSVKPGGLYFIEDWGVCYEKVHCEKNPLYKSMLGLTQYILEQIPIISPARVEIFYQPYRSVILLQR